MRQPDIEIYLRDASQDAVTEWLSQAIGPCSPWQPKGQTFKCRAADIPVTWLPKAVGKWHCLLLESDATPWEDDVACARAAHAALNVEIRCAPGSWSEDEAEDAADRWVCINDEGEREILWHTS
ncbi:hypothetical protein MST27_05095 [Pseudomonas sp. PS1]|uniref:Uncharacterized protein n=1 Tax=Stutzerimonas marianensis TaxID=2929513 RepID=A0A9X1W7C7_9GAMM|nr:hypothetical protein [Pseudomonas marianensis]MCJ0972743.1 hypothetical protein [Pseudomonas marianensis]